MDNELKNARDAVEAKLSQLALNAADYAAGADRDTPEQRVNAHVQRAASEYLVALHDDTLTAAEFHNAGLDFQQKLDWHYLNKAAPMNTEAGVAFLGSGPGSNAELVNEIRDEFTKNAAENGFDPLTKVGDAEVLREEALERAEQAAERAGQAIEEAHERAGPLVEEAQERAGEMVEDVKERAGQMMDRLKGYLPKF